MFISLDWILSYSKLLDMDMLLIFIQCTVTVYYKLNTKCFSKIIGLSILTSISIYTECSKPVEYHSESTFF